MKSRLPTEPSLARVATSPAVSARMRRVRTHDTGPELAVRSILHRQGLRFRAQAQDVPGRPDIVNRRGRWCVFVHGCFWHGHGCKWGQLPKTNVAFWEAKIQANQRRDERVEAALVSLGYRVVVVWQCELRNPAELQSRLSRLLSRPATAR